MFTPQDLRLFEKRNVTAETVHGQIERFKTGFPELQIADAARPGKGIKVLTPKEELHYLRQWKTFNGTIEKFVPASGAASRMFKNLFAFVSNGKQAPETEFETTFFDGIHQFAFYPSLNEACQRLHACGVYELVRKSRYADIITALLGKDGLDYGALPKGLLKFHRGPSGKPHTPVEEHLEEGAQYAADLQRQVNLHFTVSPEHRREFERLLDQVVPHYEQVWGVNYRITMSEQKPATDTIAVNTDDTPYRDQNGQLLFRPAGHGALIENLNEQEADVIFIKNIDNVVPAHLRNDTTHYKKIIAGYLTAVQQQVSSYLQELEHTCERSRLQVMLSYLENELCTRHEETAQMNDEELAAYLRKKFNRPLRVCGMVRNEGEPGGGPYLAQNPDGSFSPQILEAAQINENDSRAVSLMKSGTHFNPVDIVCYIKDYRGNKFDLKKFVDPNTGLISLKSVNGTEIKALELPGLWNGAMSDWITLFVEVPISTFNPVKTVNDLLRPQHQ